MHAAPRREPFRELGCATLHELSQYGECHEHSAPKVTTTLAVPNIDRAARNLGNHSPSYARDPPATQQSSCLTNVLPNPAAPLTPMKPPPRSCENSRKILRQDLIPNKVPDS